MNFIKNMAHVFGCADDSKAYLTVRSYTNRMLGNVPSLTYAELNNDPLAISKMMAKEPVAVIVRDCPWTNLSIRFMEYLATPERFPLDMPGFMFRMRPAPYFIFLVNSKTKLQCRNQKILVENL
jgi:hypothetical protein